jgi:PqqD family protein of HPr-rel-A system
MYSGKTDTIPISRKCHRNTLNINKSIWRIKMKYKKNDSMDYLEIDDESLAIYDPESGDTHYISGTGKVILSLLDGKTNTAELVKKLCEIYSADENRIIGDVNEYLKELEHKKIIITYEN